MAIAGWVLDKSAIGDELAELAGSLFVCPVGELEQLYAARSARDYDVLKDALRSGFEVVEAPPDLELTCATRAKDVALVAEARRALPEAPVTRPRWTGPSR